MAKSKTTRTQELPDLRVQDAPRDVELHAVRVRIREVPYQVVTQNVLGVPVLEHRSGFGPQRPEIDPATRTDVDAEEARQDFELGQLIWLMPDDYVRLIGAGAVIDADKVLTVEDGEEVELLDVRTAPVDDLADWIRESKPTANEVVQASNGEPELAQKLLEAENVAKDGDPRNAVVDGLAKVIGAA